MLHKFEFIARINDGKIFHMNYIGKTSRHSKVKEKILQDLKQVYNINPFDVDELYLKPEKKNK